MVFSALFIPLLHSFSLFLSPLIHVGLTYCYLFLSLFLPLCVSLRTFLTGTPLAILLAPVYARSFVASGTQHYSTSTSSSSGDILSTLRPRASSLKLQDQPSRPSSRPRGKGVKNRPGAGLSVALGISTCTDISVGMGKLTCASILKIRSSACGCDHQVWRRLMLLLVCSH